MLEKMSTQTQIKLIIEEKGFSQNQIAKESGVSASAISGYLKGTYAGDTESIEEKLKKWITANTRKKEKYNTLLSIPKWIELPSSKKVISVLEYAQAAGDIGVIYGCAGVGKTCTINHYADTNPNVWIATMTSAHAGVAPCLEEISLALDMRGTPGRSARLLREVFKRVRDTSGLLIIDEAQHLLPAALEVIRSIHDAGGIGVVLCGNESVYSMFTGGGAMTATFAQLFSRIGKRLRLTRPLKKDILGVARAFGVVGKKEDQVIWEIGKKPSGLRGVVKTLRMARMFSQGDNRGIDRDSIMYAWQDLTGEQIIG